MATVSGYTAGRTKLIEDSTVVGGEVDQVTKHLILRRRDGTPIDAGKITGAQGDKGDPGMGNVNTVAGKFGPDIILDPSDVGALPATQQASELIFGSTRYSTDAEASAMALRSRAITPKNLASVSQARWERRSSTLAGLGAGLYAGQLALLTLSSNTFPVEVLWTGSRWEPVSGRMSGTQAQRDAFEVSGICFEGIEWYNTTSKATAYWGISGWMNNSSGLVPIDEFNVSNTGGTIDRDSSGRVNFNSTADLRFDNIFSPRYKNFKIMYNIHGVSTTASMFLQMSKGGVPDQGAIYPQAGAGYRLGSAGIVQQHQGHITNATIGFLTPSWPFGSATMEMINPGAWGATEIAVQGWASDATSVFTLATSVYVDVLTVYDGFRIFLKTGNFSGSIQIYAYS